MLDRHRTFAGRTRLRIRCLPRERPLPDRRSFIAVSEEVQKRRKRCVQQFIVNIGPHAEELPDLTVFERNLEDVSVPLVSQSFDLWIEYFDGGNV